MFTPLKDILKHSTTVRTDIAGPVSIARTIECAEECLKAVIPEIEGVRVHSLRDGALLLVTESTLLAHETHLHAAKFISCINARLGHTAVERVKYRIEKKSDEL